MASHVPSDNFGSMPSLFSSSSRSPSSATEPTTPTATGPYSRKGSITLEALTRGLRKKSEIEVVLDGKNDFVRTYSTFDQIKGHVELKFEKDTLIGDMIIFFEGQSQTYVEKIAAASPTTGRTTGRHTFLRVQQPISAGSLPEHNLAKAGVLYTIPFTFVVPDRLLPHVCTHKVDNEEVTKAHLKLPPSIGDPLLAGEGNTLMDDLAPEMAKVIYSIKAKVGKASSATGKLVDIQEKAVRIRIVPAREEEPPLSLEDDNKSYSLRKEKNVRKGVFKMGKKLGRLTAEVAQTKSLRLPAPASTNKTPVTTMAAVTLRFDPVSEQEQPPQLNNMSAKLKVYTFFGAAAYKIIPEISRCDNWSALNGLYPESVPLSCRNVGSVTWTKHAPESGKASPVSADSELSRRDSNFSTETSTSSNSTASIPNASSSYDSSLPFYTAKVLVPVTLPQTFESDEPGASSSKSPLHRNSKRIIFTPSFHTCIVSRTYALELALSFRPASSSGGSNTLTGSSVSLRTPIQISQESSSPPPADAATDLLSTGYDPSLIEGTDEYDEAMARHLDAQLNFSFSNPFHPGSHVEAIPEYEEVQTDYGPQRHASIAVPPSATTQAEQPPEYYSPFRSSSAGVPQAGGRRVSLARS